MADDLAHKPVIDAKTIPQGESPGCSTGGPGCAVNPISGKGEGQAFSLAYIEFDDAGEFWSIGNERKDKVGDKAYSPSQLEQTVALIENKRKEAEGTNQRLLVLSFVHGWQNNASEHDEMAEKNLRSFKSSLQYLTTHCEVSHKNKEGRCPIVVGVFFAWRGRTIYTPYLHIVSYSNRRNVANHVGGPSMTEAVMLLAQATKGTPAAYTQQNMCQQGPPEAGVKAQFLIVGHSFGGRVLEHGVTQPILALLLERKKQAEACVAEWNLASGHSDQQLAVKIVPPLDLIALLNPANDALEAKSMIEAFKRSGLEDSEFNHPLILAIKSQGDGATGPIMLIAQSIAGARPAKRLYDRGVTPGPGKDDKLSPSACQQGQLGLKGQSFYYDRSSGGIFNMASHQIMATADLKTGKAVEPKDEIECKALENPMVKDRQYFWGSDNPKGKGGRCFEVRTAKSILEEDAGKYADRDVQRFYSCPPNLYSDPSVTRKLTLTVPVWNNTPYYVINAPVNFIKGHDDIFQLGVLNLITLMTREEQSVSLTYGPGTIRSQAMPNYTPNSAVPKSNQER